MGLLWRLFAPRPLKKARRALHPSWVLEDAIVRGVRGSRKRRRSRNRRRRPPKIENRRPPGHEGRVFDPETGQTWRCPHDHRTQAAAQECAEAMDRRIDRLGWAQATGQHPAPRPRATPGAGTYSQYRGVPVGTPQRPEEAAQVQAELDRLKKELAARPQTFRATLQFPEGDQVCCEAGHPTREAAREHGEQIAVGRGYDGVNEAEPS